MINPTCDRCGADRNKRLPAYVSAGIGRSACVLDLCDTCATEIACAVAIMLEVRPGIATPPYRKWSTLAPKEKPP